MHPAGPLPFPTLPLFLLVAAWERLELIRRGSPRAVSSSCSELCAKVTQTQRGKHRVNALLALCDDKQREKHHQQTCCGSELYHA